jgi:bacterioferritin-associated ferredoxin
MIVCICKSITVKDIEDYVRSYPTISLSDIMKNMDVCSDCGICAATVVNIINTRLESLTKG